MARSGLPRSARANAHRLLLAIYGRLPERARVAIVHGVAPTYSVGANGVVERDDGSVLLVRHTYRARWGLPGGLTKRGEHHIDTVVRELAEEVGAVVEVTSEPEVVVEPGPRRVDISYRVRLVSGEPSPRSPEIAEVGWFARDALPLLEDDAVASLAAHERRRRRC